MSDDVEPTAKGPSAGAPEATPPAPARVPSNLREPGSRGTGTVSRSVPTQDLSDDKLILSARRTDVAGLPTPVLGGIPLLARLGQGGMGAVYYGIHPRLDTEVAVKVLPFHLAEKNPDMIARLYREAKIAAQVRSPHLVLVSDVNEEQGLYYLVMEFVRGDTAGALVRSVRNSGHIGLEELVALDICIAATMGLAAAHEQGIIHRDVKPENIMVPRRRPAPDSGSEFDYCAAKLADLGLARGEGLDTTLTAENAAMGTPGFMPPEQIEDARSCGKPADVFSMGVTLYALLCGRSPFVSDSFMKTMRATAEMPHASIRTLRTDVSETTSQCIDRCLPKNPADRFQDATALLAALQLCREALVSPGKAGSNPAEVLTQLQRAKETGLPVTVNTPALASAPKPLATPPTANATPVAPPRARTSSRSIIPAAIAACAVVGALVWKIGSGPAANPERSTVTPVATVTEKPSVVATVPDAHAEELARRKESFDREYRSLNAMLQADPDQVLARLPALETLAAPDAGKGFPDLNAGLATTLAEMRTSAEAAIKMRTMADDKQKQQLAEQALSTAFTAAAMAEQRNDWDAVIVALEEPLKAIGTHPHPNRKAADALLELARQKKQDQTAFAEKLSAAEKDFREGRLAAAQAGLEACQKLWPASPDAAHVKDLLTQIAQAANTSDFQNAISEGAKAATERRWADAESAYARALKIKPGDAKIEQSRMHAMESGQLERVKSLTNQQNFDGALAACQAVLKSNPNSAAAKASLEGVLDALCNQGRKLRDGTPSNYAEANACFRKAADLGYGPACDCLGRVYENGLGVKIDLVEAARWIRLGSASGYIVAQLNYARLLEHGTGVPQNQSEADRINAIAYGPAEKYCLDHPYAEVLVTLGWLYSTGRGVQKDYDKAIKTYQRATEMGYLPAEAFLGNMYVNVPEVPENYAEARTHFLKAANRGLAIAQFEMGNLYERGLGVEKNYVEAANWYLKGAEQEHPHSEHNLASLYLTGQGVPKAPATALMWLRRAEEHGDISVDVNIGRMYANGEGVEKDLVEAARWYRKAAFNGDQYGQVNLGFFYQEGKGVEKDPNLAATWYRKAAAQGNADAIRYLKLMGLSKQ